MQRPGIAGIFFPCRKTVTRSMVFGRPGRPFHRDLIRRDASVTALSTTVPPNAARNPAHGLSSKALPPRRPMKNAYSAQITAAMALAMTNRRRW